MDDKKLEEIKIELVKSMNEFKESGKSDLDITFQAILAVVGLLIDREIITYEEFAEEFIQGLKAR